MIQTLKSILLIVSIVTTCLGVFYCIVMLCGTTTLSISLGSIAAICLYALFLWFKCKRALS